MNKIVIAIDGHSSCGKSTLAQYLAKQLGYVYIDTGAMYRAVALYCKRHNWLAKDVWDKQAITNALDQIEVSFVHHVETNVSQTYLNGENVEEEIRGIAVSEVVSKVSQMPEVRKKLVQLQQQLGASKGVVMDGRDIGTRVFPQAELKLFVTADINIRVQRRFDQMVNKGIDITFEEVKSNLQQRDFDDTHRGENPLQKADDAVVLDNSNLTIDQQNEKALEWATERINGVNS